MQVDKTISKVDASMNDMVNNDQIISVASDESEKSSKLNIDSYLDQGQKAYEILKYNENCEEHNQISYILPLVRTNGKFVIFIILNIFTVGLINLFVAWFPKMILYRFKHRDSFRNFFKT